MVKDERHLMALWTKTAILVNRVSPCHDGPVRFVHRQGHWRNTVLLYVNIPALGAAQLIVGHVGVDQSATHAVKRER